MAGGLKILDLTPNFQLVLAKLAFVFYSSAKADEQAPLLASGTVGVLKLEETPRPSNPSSRPNPCCVFRARTQIRELEDGLSTFVAVAAYHDSSAASRASGDFVRSGAFAAV